MKNKKILFLTPYPFGKAPSQRLKFEQYYNFIKSNGFDISTNAFMSEKMWNIVYKKGNFLLKIYYTFIAYIKRFLLLFSVSKYDVVYIHLWVTPLGLPIFEWLICALNKNIVYDIDDMIFLNQTSSINKIIQLIKGKQKPIFLIKNAKQVITCTPDLNNFALKLNKNCTDISSTLDTDKFLPKNNYTNENPIIIGWTGSHSTIPYLFLLENVFQKLALQRNFKLLVIVSNYNFEMQGVQTECLQWTEANEILGLQQMDIGVYPLPNEDWVKGKSGLKALQYMCFGLPVVASKIGDAIQRVITENETGFLVETEEEWLEKLIFLIDNATERKRIGENGRQNVLENFSIIANQNIYLQVIQKAIL